jgi:spore coat polysaccharide biosynthesis protein SpsF (cytidylyltransferase family)
MKATHAAKARAILRLDGDLPFAKAEKELSHLYGVLDYEINYVNNSVRVEYDPEKTTMDAIQKLVHK